MQVKQLTLLSAFFLVLCTSYGQAIQNPKVNTSGAEAYFKIATALVKGDAEKIIPWQSLFQTPPYQMMIAGYVIDTADLKSNMETVFSPTSTQSKSAFSSDESYHLAYKNNQKKLESYIKQLRDLNVIDSIKALLNPYLPLRLQSEELFPTLFYFNYGSADATGMGGIVFNDLLHSYKIDQYKFGLLAAHEAFHSVVSTAFQKKLKIDIDFTAPDFKAPDFNLLYFLQNIAEEGVADLIDKPLLLQLNSPLYQEVRQLTTDDDSLSIVLINGLDSVLTLANGSNQILQQYRDFTSFEKDFGKNGGHVPGRFMGKVIKDAGLLQNHIDVVEDPISFILTYNEAVIKNGKKYPKLSIESVLYLQKLKKKFWRD